MSAVDPVRTPDAPLPLDEAPPRTLGLRANLGLWANLGVSLLLPVAAGLGVLPGRPPAGAPARGRTRRAGAVRVRAGGAGYAVGGVLRGAAVFLVLPGRPLAVTLAAVVVGAAV